MKTKDFYCSKCGEDFQLKASGHKIGHQISGAAYATTLESLKKGQHPSLILLSYDTRTLQVSELEVIHRRSITQSCLLPRKPLTKAAVRYPWQGCNYLLTQIPKAARMRIVENGNEHSKKDVMEKWRLMQSTFKGSFDNRGWTADVMKCVEKQGSTFTLRNIYEFENHLSSLHPENHHVREKIRQQLQVLRDSGLLRFVKHGVYAQATIHN